MSKGNPRRKGAQWKWLRQQVFKRDRWQCQDCGLFGQVLECDHIVPLEDGGSDSIENLQSLCVACHHAKTRRENAVHDVKGATEWAAFAAKSPWQRRRHA